MFEVEGGARNPIWRGKNTGWERERDRLWGERKNQLKKWEEREKSNKKIINSNAIFVPTMAKLQRYCPMLQKFDTFNTFDKTPFLVFSVPNVPYYSI